MPRVPGTAIFLTGNAQDVPAALLHNMKHNKVLHDHNIILTVVTEEVPRLRMRPRHHGEALGALLARDGAVRLHGEPESAEGAAAGFDLDNASFFLSRPGPAILHRGTAAVAGLHLHSDGALGKRRVGPVLHSRGSGGRGGLADHDLIGASGEALEHRSMTIRDRACRCRRGGLLTGGRA